MLISQTQQIRMLSIQSFCLTAVMSLCAFTSDANASLIFESFSLTASDLVKSASMHDAESAFDVPWHGGFSTDDSMATATDTSADPNEPSASVLFWQVYLSPNSCSNDTGASGPSSSGPQSSPSAICEYSNELSGWMLISWLDRTSFQYLPDAPRSGLMRPPQSVIA